MAAIVSSVSKLKEHRGRFPQPQRPSTCKSLNKKGLRALSFLGIARVFMRTHGTLKSSRCPIERRYPAVRISTLLNKLIGLQGLWVRAVEFQQQKNRVVVDVFPRRYRRHYCGQCGRKVRKRKDRKTRYWRHLNLFGKRTYLRYSIWRVVCRRCGVVTQQVPWAERGSRFTIPFERQQPVS